MRSVDFLQYHIYQWQQFYLTAKSKETGFGFTYDCNVAFANKNSTYLVQPVGKPTKVREILAVCYLKAAGYRKIS